MKDDLVVVVPGIMGTALTRDGLDVWDLTPQAVGGVLGPRRTSELLRLQEGIGDGDPEPPHALEVGRAIDGARLLPGLISDTGCAGLQRRLGIERERFAVFPYDWRLSNRNSARKLKRFVDERLDRWQETADPTRYPRARDAKVIFLCRSMGGLVVRYYTEVLGGWERTRSVATLGTPFSGSVKALRFLTGRARWLPGSLNEWLHGICSTYPSLGQLIPTYRVVLDEERGRDRLNSRTPVEGVGPWMIADSAAYFVEINNAIRANDAAHGRDRYGLFAFGGDKHRTDQAVSFSPDGRPTFHSDFSKSTDPEDRYVQILGDGTVAHIAQTPPEWPSTGRTLWLESRHADLINADAAIHQLKRMCDDLEPARALSSEHPVGVELPDVAAAGEPFEVWATNADAAMRLRVRRLAEDGTCVGDDTMHPCGDGTFRAELRAEAGRWTLEVCSTTADYACRDVILVM
ncbi:esterase/lipase family protein [Streptomyces sp. NPDC059567]|uniref:esterase/lipase family protein n=1 Tax=Streptomyces sp. NPDC059567 TaxID=3346867 RepID=UPI0036995C32